MREERIQIISDDFTKEEKIYLRRLFRVELIESILEGYLLNQAIFEIEWLAIKENYKECLNEFLDAIYEKTKEAKRRIENFHNLNNL